MSNRELILSEIEGLLKSEHLSPYIFRTRFERSMLRVISWAKENSLEDIENISTNLKEKLHLISNQSNPNSDGSLKSFKYLQKDIIQLKKCL